MKKIKIDQQLYQLLRQVDYPYLLSVDGEYYLCYHETKPTTRSEPVPVKYTKGAI